MVQVGTAIRELVIARGERLVPRPGEVDLDSGRFRAVGREADEDLATRPDDLTLARVVKLLAASCFAPDPVGRRGVHAILERTHDHRLLSDAGQNEVCRVHQEICAEQGERSRRLGEEVVKADHEPNACIANPHDREGAIAWTEEHLLECKEVDLAVRGEQAVGSDKDGRVVDAVRRGLGQSGDRKARAGTAESDEIAHRGPALNGLRVPCDLCRIHELVARGEELGQDPKVGRQPLGEGQGSLDIALPLAENRIRLNDPNSHQMPGARGARDSFPTSWRLAAAAASDVELRDEDDADEDVEQGREIEIHEASFLRARASADDSTTG